MAKLKGKDKALIFLSSIGDDVSKKVLGYLPDKISSKITAELNAFEKPSPDAIALVFRELNRFALSFINRPKLTGPDAVVEQPKTRSPKELMAVLQDEQPQLVAFVLSYLPADVVDAYYDLLSPGRRNEIKKVTVTKNAFSEAVYKALYESHIAKALQ